MLRTQTVGAVIVGAIGVGIGLAGASRIVSSHASPKYVLHVYDHCPFCNRVEFLMQNFEIPYDRVVYGYGAGADPDKCEGHGYGVGPVELTGKKMLPVLQGEGVPCAPGAVGMPESMEICSFLIARHQLVAPCESGRADVKRFTEDLTKFKADLAEHRMVRMPVADWADSRDVAYRRWKKKLPIEPPPVEPQPELIEKLNAKLAELPALLKGGCCLNVWGWGMDDVVLLPLLRVFTCVKGVCLPPAVEKYLAFDASQMTDYRRHAL